MKTTMRGRRWCAALAVAGTLGVTAVAVGPAAAQEDKACTRGDAEKVTQVGLLRRAKTLAGHTRHGVIESMAHCQVQLTADGAHYTFSDDDVFALQNTFFVPWRCYFGTPQESVADFGLYETRAWIAPVEGGVVGDATQVELSATPVKTAVFTEPVPGWEECFPGTATQVHYQTASAIVDLASGEYVATWEDVYAGGEPYTSAVRITVLPD